MHTSFTLNRIFTGKSSHCTKLLMHPRTTKLKWFDRCEFLDGGTDEKKEISSDSIASIPTMI